MNRQPVLAGRRWLTCSRSAAAMRRPLRALAANRGHLDIGDGPTDPPGIALSGKQRRPSVTRP
jgi:hypothetical protein